MAEDPKTPSEESSDATLDHMLEEVRDLEGVGAKGKIIKWLGILVALAVIVGGVYLAQRSTPERTRAKSEGNAIELQEPRGGKHFETPSVFKWQSVAGRHHYEIAIGTSKGGSEILDERQVKTNTYTLSDDQRTQLTKGQKYYWRVKAVGPDGKTVGHGEGRFEM